MAFEINSASRCDRHLFEEFHCACNATVSHESEQIHTSFGKRVFLHTCTPSCTTTGFPPSSLIRHPSKPSKSQPFFGNRQASWRSISNECVPITIRFTFAETKSITFANRFASRPLDVAVDKIDLIEVAHQCRQAEAGQLLHRFHERRLRCRKVRECAYRFFRRREGSGAAVDAARIACLGKKCLAIGKTDHAMDGFSDIRADAVGSKSLPDEIYMPGITFDADHLDFLDAELFRGDISDHAPWRPASTKLQHREAVASIKRRTEGANPFESVTVEITRYRISLNNTRQRIESRRQISHRSSRQEN